MIKPIELCLFPALATALALVGQDAMAAPLKEGDTHLLVLEHESASESSDGSTSSSSGTDVLVAQVLTVRDDGVEVEYDSPPEDGEQAGGADWHLPVRIFWPTTGTPRITNRAEVAARVDPWLAKGGMTRDACGQWIFTWNAFLIDCDPDSAFKGIERFQLGSVALREGMPFETSGAIGSAALVPIGPESGTKGFTADYAIDPEVIREQVVENDLVVAQITGDSLTREEATMRHAADQISGTVAVTIETDADGYPVQRTSVSKVRTTKPDGSHKDVETRSTLRRESMALTRHLKVAEAR